MTARVSLKSQDHIKKTHATPLLIRLFTTMPSIAECTQTEVTAC